MKVKLIGIRPYDHEIDGELDEVYQSYVDLLKQIPFPLEIETIHPYPITVILKQYIIDPLYPDSEEEWGLNWFEYEEVKEVED